MPLLRAATHDGLFHADDLTATAILSILHPGMQLTRTRNPAILASQDLVFDVGGTFEPARLRFDHHQAGSPLKPDGTPFSSAGMIWTHYQSELAARFPKANLQEIRTLLIEPIDRCDNGVADQADSPGRRLATGLATLNPNWNESGVSLDERFQAGQALLVPMMQALLDGRPVRQTIEGAVLALGPHEERSRQADLDGKRQVEEALARQPGAPILLLDKYLPWDRVMDPAEHPALEYVVFPRDPQSWIVRAAPARLGSFDLRTPLPEPWRGLTDASLQQASGISDAVFCHRNGFMALTQSQSGALDMALKSLELAHGPELASAAARLLGIDAEPPLAAKSADLKHARNGLSSVARQPGLEARG